MWGVPYLYVEVVRACHDHVDYVQLVVFGPYLAQETGGRVLGYDPFRRPDRCPLSLGVSFTYYALIVGPFGVPFASGLSVRIVFFQCRVTFPF